MVDLGELELWNVAPAVHAVVGAQAVFNVVGRLRSPATVESLSYRLNGGDERPVAFRRVGSRSKRLVRPGDFNIDTILVEELHEENVLTMRLGRSRRPVWEEEIVFPVRWFDAGASVFRLDLENANRAQEVGQIVDGRWRLLGDEHGRRCLELGGDDAGYDRIITFGDRHWTDGYEVHARLCVRHWTSELSHGAGLAFKWNAHRQGDGNELPEEWTSGVAWYFSESPGLTIRMGANARKDASGRWIGEQILAERALSPRRLRFARLTRYLWPTRHFFSQLRTGRTHEFRLRMEPRRWVLSTTPDGGGTAPVQVECIDPPRLIERGSVGVIAHGCALRLYELEVRPLS
jgi:hypothetical protein